MSYSQISHIEFLRRIHADLKPTSYLEIGVETGRSINLAACRAVGIDPYPLCRTFENKDVRLYEMTSDAFFATQDVGKIFPAGIDLAFIDGMHLFEFALRDFMNIERNSNEGTLVALHDCSPPNVEWAERERTQEQWCGDVWKLLPILNRFRPDLKITVYDCHLVGVVLVSNLLKSSNVLQKAYEEILEAFTPLSLRDYGLVQLRNEFPSQNVDRLRL